jgi:hypothetical protein
VRAFRRAVAFLVGLALLTGVAAAAPASSGPYRPGGQPVSPFGPGPLDFSVAQLSSISMASAQDGWIVGRSSIRDSKNWPAIAWRWDGTAWRKSSLAKVAGQIDLSSVATVGDGEAWAVGSSGADDSLPLVEHWDGQSWQVASLPPERASYLDSVSADGPADAWAAGATYPVGKRGQVRYNRAYPLLLHWDGASWSSVDAPWIKPGAGEGTTVVATAPDDVWVVVAGSRIEHWDGITWTHVPSPFGPLDPPAAFDATSADDAWAVGSYRQSRHSRVLAAHWDGQSWQISPAQSRNSDSWLSQVVAVAPDDVWAMGERESVHYGRCGHRCWSESATDPIPLLEHWDGHGWKVMPGGKPYLWFYGDVGLAAAADGTASAFGSCLSDNVLMRWDGSAWKVVRHPPDQHWGDWVPPKWRRQGFGHCAVAKHP